MNLCPLDTQSTVKLCQTAYHIWYQILSSDIVDYSVYHIQNDVPQYNNGFLPKAFNKYE